MNIFQRTAVTFVLKTLFGIKKVRTFLQGKKTYILGASIIINAIIKWLEPNPDTTILVTQLLIGAGLMTVHAAIVRKKEG